MPFFEIHFLPRLPLPFFCDEATIKQIVCILVSRLLNPMGAEETAGLIAGLAEAEQEVLDALKNKEEVIHWLSAVSVKTKQQ